MSDTKTEQHGPMLPQLSIQQFQLEVVRGLDKGNVVTWQNEDITVGTDAGNLLTLNDKSVSRHHCVITPSSKIRRFQLRDLDSTNGTFINDVRVESAYLTDGDTIRVGFSNMRFRLLKQTVEHELSMEASFGDLIGASPSIRKLFALLPVIASADSTMLILGETGTGKSMLAEAIHAAGPRSDGPLVVVDCASIAPNLIESELFGHERGAFTGAHDTKLGVFETSKNGTLLLDEIGELPLALQGKLLRAIEDRQIRRVGGTKTIDIKCRVLAATNRDLRTDVNRGAFRSDLFYRLNVVALKLPPLRERREDIPLLIRSFLKQYGGQQQVAPDLMNEWSNRSWPGNVRELRNAVERAVLLGTPRDDDSAMISTVWQPDAVTDDDGKMLPFREAKGRALSDWETGYLKMVLERHDGNLSRAAREARMDRGYMRELARKRGPALSAAADGDQQGRTLRARVRHVHTLDATVRDVAKWLTRHSQVVVVATSAVVAATTT